LDDSNLSYTVSIGCTFEFSNNLDSMIQLADKNLYKAKNEGRNKVRYR
jgi:PleD family two-component response regulator